jgi:putative restriction endonuclease
VKFIGDPPRHFSTARGGFQLSSRRMVKAILTTKVNPTYDDLPEERYHFPRSYLRQVEQAVGDFVVYYEPRRNSGDLSSRGGRQAYFAVASITAVGPDSALADHFYARIANYLEFDRAVPFREGENYYESFLRREDGKTSKGAFGRAVRALPDEEFAAILRAGFFQDESPFPLQPVPKTSPPGFDEPQADFERPIIERLVARPFRDRAFTRQIRLAYDNRCAVTGLRLINGGGRPEVQAAHIRPVASAGPDSPRNGIALCGTAHWMFDRGLISIDDDFRILTTTQGVPEDVARLFRPDRQLWKPDYTSIQPHPQFLRWHRENVFKG